MAGLIKAVLALKSREIPPLVNFRAPNPQLELELEPVRGECAGAAWISNGAPRRAGVSSFGIGGTNAHVVLEEAPAASPGTSRRRAHLHRPVGKNGLGTRAKRDSVCGSSRGGSGDVAGRGRVDAAKRPQALRTPPNPRCFRCSRDHPEAEGASSFTEADSVHDGGVRPVAFLFSGQGSQHVGMGHEAYRAERVYGNALDRCAAIFQPHLGVDIRRVLSGDLGEQAITETRLAQPVLFSTEYALAILWMQWGDFLPSSMLGHSIGEYVAAQLAGVFSLEDAIAVVAMRARLMQDCRPAVWRPCSSLANGSSGAREKRRRDCRRR